jgi:hypothetical protein
MKDVDGFFDYSDPSYGNDSSCHLRIYRMTDYVTVAIATELAENKGPSITNSSEALWREVVKEYDLDPEKTWFVEHYPGNSEYDKYSFSTVSFTWLGEYATKPQWKHITRQEIERLIGERLD